MGTEKMHLANFFPTIFLPVFTPILLPCRRLVGPSLLFGFPKYYPQNRHANVCCLMLEETQGTVSGKGPWRAAPNAGCPTFLQNIGEGTKEIKIYKPEKEAGQGRLCQDLASISMN